MYKLYFDAGTTNTRGYLLKGNKLIDAEATSIGSKDVAISKNKDAVLEVLKKLYDKILARNNLAEPQIEQVYGSGMLASPFGIICAEHINMPAGVKEIAQGMAIFEGNNIFPRSIIIVTGLKSNKKKISLKNINDMNNMRGEETEIIGIMDQISNEMEDKKYAVILPGSHTHTALIENNKIVDCLSQFAGELYFSLREATALAGGISSEKPGFSAVYVKKAFANLQTMDLTRGIYIAHAMKVFDVGDNYKRKSYLSGLIAGAAVKEITNTLQNRWKGVEQVIVYGKPEIVEIYGIALKFFAKNVECRYIKVSKGQDPCSIKGILKIIEERERVANV